MRFKLFTYGDAVDIEALVNAWLEDNDHMIEVMSTHFSTTTTDGRVKNHVAIFYTGEDLTDNSPEDYSDDTEEDRMERLAQEHLEAAARHRDDPMFF